MKQERIQNTQPKQNVRTPPPGSSGRRDKPSTEQDDAIGNRQHADQARHAEKRNGNRADKDRPEDRQPSESEQTREDIQRAEEEGMLRHKKANEPHDKDRVRAGTEPAKQQDRPSHKQHKSPGRH